MKILKYLVLGFFVFACDSENSSDCFQKTGDLIKSEIILESFDKIYVNRDIELIIKEGLQQKVVIETGKNLLNDVEAIVLDNKMTLTDKNTCNYVRGYGITKVYVTSPNITEIRSSTQYDIRSDGVLTYPNLTILSENFFAPESFTVGNFKLQINNASFSVVFNNLSICYVSGQTNNLDIGFFAGTSSRFEGQDLLAQNVKIFTRSSNDIYVNPLLKLTGTITGTGDVISLNTPPTIEMEELYRGRLIFE